MWMLAEMTLTQMFFENPWPVVVAMLGSSVVLRTLGKRPPTPTPGTSRKAPGASGKASGAEIKTPEGGVRASGASGASGVFGDSGGGRRLVGASWVALLLGVGVVVLAAVVNTDREVLIARTQALAAATSLMDESALAALLADNALLLGPEGDVWDSLDAAVVAQKLKAFRVEVFNPRDINAIAPRPNDGISTLTVSHKVLGQRIAGTGWEIAWRRDGEGLWKITSMKWLAFGLNTPNRNLYR